MSEVWRTSLPTSEKMVLLVIADHASDEGDNAWPSQRTIAERASCTIRTVQRCVNNLVKAGYLTMEKGAGGSATCRDDRRPHLYTINLAKLRGDKMTRRPKDSNEASLETDTGRLSRPMNHSNEPSKKHPSKFESFWNFYPKKVGKIAAEKAFNKAVQSGADATEIVLGAMRYAKDKSRLEAFTAHPATWINAGRWLDEITPEKPAVSLNKFDPKEFDRPDAKPMPDYIKNMFKKPT